MNKKITEVDSVESLDNVTSFFVNDGDDIKQVGVSALNLDKINSTLSEHSLQIIQMGVSVDAVNKQMPTLLDYGNQIKNINSLLQLFDYAEIGAGEKYYITQAGLYLFAGNDYDLNLYNYDWEGKTASVVGKSNNLISALFVTENHKDSNYLHTFYGKTYKGTLGVATPESGVTDLLNTNSARAYVENTSSSGIANVFWLKLSKE